MRAVRLSAFGLAVFLMCLVISHVVSLEPAPARVHTGGGLTKLPGPPAKVPPPPPLNGSPVMHPAKKLPTPTHPGPTQVAAGEQQELDAPTDAKPIIRELGEAVILPAADQKPIAAATEPQEQKGPVIVVPHERPKEDSRGVRWMKAVGHAVGIGGAPSPEDRAFQER